MQEEVQETRVRPLDQEDPLEEELTTHSSILSGKIPRTEEAGGLYSPQCPKEWDTTERLTYPRKKIVHILNSKSTRYHVR